MAVLRNPLAWLLAAYVVFSVSHAAALSRFPYAESSARRLEGLVLGFIAACWIARDSKDRKMWPTDLSMIFYPLLFPTYMIGTRKWKGVFWIIVLWLGYALTYWVPRLLLEDEA